MVEQICAWDNSLLKQLFHPRVMALTHLYSLQSLFPVGQ